MSERVENSDKAKAVYNLLKELFGEPEAFMSVVLYRDNDVSFIAHGKTIDLAVMLANLKMQDKNFRQIDNQASMMFLQAAMEAKESNKKPTQTAETPETTSPPDEL